MKLKCRGKAAGVASCTFVPFKFRVLMEDGGSNPGFGNLARQNLMVLVQ